MTSWRSQRFMMLARGVAVFSLCLLGCGMLARAAEATLSQNSQISPLSTKAVLHFNVRGYVVAGNPLLPTNTLTSLFSRYTGPNVSLDEIVKAASALQLAYHNQGYPAVSVAFVPEQITGGIITFNVAQTAIPQIVVAGERYLSLSNGVEIVSQPPVAAPAPPQPSLVASAATTNVISAEVTNIVPLATNLATTRASYQEMVDAMAAMHMKMAELDIQAKDTRVHIVSTNAGPRFEVEKYLVNGNSILPPSAIGQATTNIDGAFGTNVSFDGVQTVVNEVGKAYKERGYGMVKVDVPQQKLTNATVKLQVLEGRLADIKVAGNRYFSSNNVMRALPSLHTNMAINVPIFYAELNRANADQDRQIYPVIGPGPELGTSELTLNIKDRLPLHAKLEFDNQNSPGTPDMRLNASAVYNNLWQAENSLGVQYGFSPEVYKLGNQWDFYDRPTVAYYSGYYRLPLGNPEPIENVVANNPGSFGYSEATRQFRLPPPSGQPELTLYASRATIDPGVETLSSSNIFAAPNNIFTIDSKVFQQGITLNEAAGFRLTKPLPEIDNVRSTLLGGLDFKRYSQDNYNTNLFIFTEVTLDANNNPTPHTTPVPSPITTRSTLDYLPLQLEYHANLQDAFGPATWGLGLSANLWYSSSYFHATGVTNYPSLNGLAGLTNITGSAQSTGHWVILRPSFSQDITLYNNWTTTIRADGQWASEPVISPEQFGAGGVNSVRGYHEGEVFGDTGWHVTLEQQTPPHVVGTVYDGVPLTIRGSVYMDYARVYLIDPPSGNRASTSLCGTGFGFSAAAGSHWQARFLFSWPLLSAGKVTAYQPSFNFALTAQF